MGGWRRWAMQASTPLVRVRQGNPPEHVLSWRRAVDGALRRRLKAGRGTQGEVERLLVWDVWLSGDGSKEGVVEHYHNRHCPGDERCERLVISEGIAVLLKQAPPKYNRRDYHGHRRCVDHVCLLQACAGGLLRYLPSVAATGRLSGRRHSGALEPAAPGEATAAQYVQQQEDRIQSIGSRAAGPPRTVLPVRELHAGVRARACACARAFVAIVGRETGDGRGQGHPLADEPFAECLRRGERASAREGSACVGSALGASESRRRCL